jgi:hypothetical protein
MSISSIMVVFVKRQSEAPAACNARAADDETKWACSGRDRCGHGLTNGSAMTDREGAPNQWAAVQATVRARSMTVMAASCGGLNKNEGATVPLHAGGVNTPGRTL